MQMARFCYVLSGWALVGVCALLAACGGSGDSASMNQPTAQDLQYAKAAAMTGTFDSSADSVTLSWTDTFTDSTTYQVELLGTSDTWSTVATVSGQQGSGKLLNYTSGISGTSTYRVEALLNGYSVPLDTMSGQQSVQVIVPATAPTLALITTPPVPGTTEVRISGGGTYSSVSYYLDNNTTAFASSTTGPAYSVTLDDSTLGPAAEHTIFARIPTGPDSYLELSLSANLGVSTDNPPVLTLSSPIDGGVVNGSLHLAGAFSSDKTGGVTLTATLNGLPVLNTTSSPFATDFSLAGMAPGTYTLTVVAKDSTGNSTTLTPVVVVSSSPAPTYSLLLTIYGSATSPGELLAAESSTNTLLYIDGVGPRLHTGSTDFALDTSGLTSAPLGWSVGNGNAFAEAGVSLYLSAIFMWKPDGTRVNLSTLAQSTANFSGDVLISVQWPWVLFRSDNTSYTFYNVETGVRIAPALVTSAEVGAADFYSSAQGQLVLYYWAETSTAPTQQSGIFRWDQSSGQSTAVTNGAVASSFVQTDGQRVAWQVLPTSLVTLDIASGQQQTLTTTVGGFNLANGLLAYRDSTTTKVSDGTTVTTLSTAGTELPLTSGGYVAFVGGLQSPPPDVSQLYAWSPAGGLQTVFGNVSGYALMSGGTVYFTSGSYPLLVYSVTLN